MLTSEHLLKTVQLSSGEIMRRHTSIPSPLLAPSIIILKQSTMEELGFEKVHQYSFCGVTLADKMALFSSLRSRDHDGVTMRLTRMFTPLRGCFHDAA